MLDFAALEQGVITDPGDAVITTSFALISIGLLTKAAQVPFHFWLSDAHVVAPSPVSVIFSGAMVALGLYGVAKLTWTMFAPSVAVQQVVHTLLLGIGVASAMVGGVMALIQRHVKRLLAFSTISHTGIMATLGGIDEVGLRGKGSGIWPARVAMAVGGLLLAGLPLGLMDQGTTLIETAAHAAGQSWTMLGVINGTVCTGGAVLQITGRIFLGWGPVPGEEERSPTEDEQEKADRPLWLMLSPVVVLILLAMFGARADGGFAARAATSFMHPDVGAILGPGAATVPSVPVDPGHGPSTSMMPWLSVPLALAVAGFQLTRCRLPGLLLRGSDRIAEPVLRVLNGLHSGLIGGLCRLDDAGGGAVHAGVCRGVVEGAAGRESATDFRNITNSRHDIGLQAMPCENRRKFLGFPLRSQSW